MSENTEDPRLPDPTRPLDNQTVNDKTLSETLVNNEKTEDLGGGGEGDMCKDLDSVSVTSDSPSEKRVGASAKSSGIRPPSRISRPCTGAQKPGLPVTPPKSKFFHYYLLIFNVCFCELLMNVVN